MVAPAVYDAMQAYDWPGNVRELKNVIRRMLQLTTGEIRVEHLPHAIREAYAGTVDVHTSAIDAEDARLIEVVQRAATMAEAASELGITRSTLYRRMERFGLKPGRVVRRD
jgi:transcriptional regulator of acetoin/glycerol metabolism